MKYRIALQKNEEGESVCGSWTARLLVTRGYREEAIANSTSRDPAIPCRASKRSDPFLNVVRTLTGSELDNPDVDETALVKRIFPGDGFDLLPILADCQDDPAISRYFSTRDQEMTGRVVFIQKRDMRGHVRVDFGQVRLVDKFDHEHGH